MKLAEIQREFTDYYRTSTATVEFSQPQKGSTRHLELHPSSFPPCGVRQFHSICLDPPTGVDVIPFSMAFYTSIGTAFHTAIQNCLGAGGRMMGDYTCPACGCKREATMVSVCPKCDTLMHYEELGIRVGKRTVGHVDGLFMLSDGTFIVIDYKTTSIKKLDRHRTEGEVFPTLPNVEQIRSYVVYLSSLYDIKIVGWALVYVARDNFDNFEVTAGKVKEGNIPELKAELKRWDNHCDVVVRAKSLKDIQVVIEEKPCRSVEEYYARFHNPYSPCPLHAVCFNPKSLRQTLADCLEEADHLPLTTTPLD